MVASTAFATTAPVSSAAITPAAESPVEFAPVRKVAISASVAHRIPAGWYPDRENPGNRRWWDGTHWTEHYTCPTGALTTGELATGALPTGALVTAASPRHSAATVERPPSASATSVTASGRIPLLVIVLLAGLTGANLALVSLLATR